tara:strand:- start:749 stop:3352 length:2604 start_codon:yes stop_codon:yes gene_type:complete
MKWIGQHIVDLIARFRGAVYLENISSGTIASGGHLGLDSNNKIVKAVDGGGDLTGITAGTGLSGTDLTGPVPTLNVDAAQTGVTSLGTLSSLAVTSASDLGSSAITLTNADVDQIALDINASNTTANVIDINAVTLTTGSAIKVQGNDQSDESVVLVSVSDNETVSSPGTPRALIEADASKTGVVASTESRFIYGIRSTITDSASNHANSAVSLTAFTGTVDSASTSGFNYNTGLDLTVTDATYNTGISLKVEDGGDDIKIMSSANNANYFNIQTTANGATTLTTVDNAGTDADLDFAIDGTFSVASTGIDIATNGTISNATWQGTAVASAYLDADTAHLSGVQTFTGVKTFSGKLITQSALSPKILVDGDVDGQPGDGGAIHVDAFDFTDVITSASGTAAKYTHVNIETPRLHASNASVTTTDAATLYVNGAPAAGTNQTFNRAWSLWVDSGNARFDGSIYSGTTEAINSSGLLTVANQSNITGLGTISSGTWQGTAIASAYLDADTAHLSTDQTFTGKKTFSDDVTFNCDNITFESANADDPNVLIKNTTNDNQAARLTFTKDRGAAMGDNDRVAEIDFIGEDASQNTQGYGKIMCQALESDHGVETGTVKIQVAEYDGTLTNGLVVAGGNADGVVDITLSAGAASTTTVAGDLAVTTGLILDSVDVTAIQTSGETFADDDTSLMTSAAIDDRITVKSKHVLRCASFYANGNFVQNSLFIGNSVGNSPFNWNDQAAVGGAISTTSSFTIIGDDENWGIVLPVDISKIEVQCSLRPSGNPGAIDFSVAVYTGVRSSDSSDDLTLTKIGHQSVSFNSGNQRYKQNDLTIDSLTLSAGTMIYVGVGTEDAPNNAKNGRGYMNITVTER